ncbi:MAG: response regulator transcription factor [Chloroflexi bacterium]|nr:response regulator transcription factor [Chloroflexota bacterium]
MAGRILVVEDDQTLREVLKYNLSKEGHEVLTAEDGIQALERARSHKPDLVILDIMLPRLSGDEVCRILRAETTVPIMMLTAKTDEVDKVVALELGADDYVTKPFSMRELLARIRAMLRRGDMAKGEIIAGETPPPPIKIADLDIDPSRRVVSRRGLNIDLTRMEFALLEFLARNRGQVFTRDRLLERVWGYDYAGDTRTVDVHIRWLRQKIEIDPAHPRHILTVRGVGYKFEA